MKTMPVMCLLLLVVGCASTSDSDGCSLTRVEFDALKQRVMTFFENEFPEFDPVCDSVQNATMSSELGCMIAADRKPLFTCPGEQSLDYLVVFDRVTLTPIDMYFPPESGE